MKYIETVYITKEDADKLEQALTYEPADESECFGEDDTYTVTADFPDGFKMDICCNGVVYNGSGCVSNIPYVEAVLHKDNIEVNAIQSTRFTGKWELYYDGNDYIVDVVVVSSDADKKLDIYKKRKLYEYEEASKRMKILMNGNLRSLSKVLESAKKDDDILVSDTLIFEIITQLEQIRRNISNGNKFAETANVIKTLKSKRIL